MSSLAHSRATSLDLLNHCFGPVPSLSRCSPVPNKPGCQRFVTGLWLVHLAQHAHLLKSCFLHCISNILNPLGWFWWHSVQWSFGPQCFRQLTTACSSASSCHAPMIESIWWKMSSPTSVADTLLSVSLWILSCSFRIRIDSIMLMGHLLYSRLLRIGLSSNLQARRTHLVLKPDWLLSSSTTEARGMSTLGALTVGRFSPWSSSSTSCVLGSVKLVFGPSSTTNRLEQSSHQNLFGIPNCKQRSL